MSSSLSTSSHMTTIFSLEKSFPALCYRKGWGYSPLSTGDTVENLPWMPGTTGEHWALHILCFFLYIILMIQFNLQSRHRTRLTTINKKQNNYTIIIVTWIALLPLLSKARLMTGARAPRHQDSGSDNGSYEVTEGWVAYSARTHWAKGQSISRAGQSRLVGGFITLFRSAHILKLTNCLLNFPLKIFMGNWDCCQRQTTNKGGLSSFHNCHYGFEHNAQIKKKKDA